MFEFCRLIFSPFLSCSRNLTCLRQCKQHVSWWYLNLNYVRLLWIGFQKLYFRWLFIQDGKMGIINSSYTFINVWRPFCYARFINTNPFSVGIEYFLHCLVMRSVTLYTHVLDIIFQLSVWELLTGKHIAFILHTLLSSGS